MFVNNVSMYIYMTKQLPEFPLSSRLGSRYGLVGLFWPHLSPVKPLVSSLMNVHVPFLSSWTRAAISRASSPLLCGLCNGSGEEGHHPGSALLPDCCSFSSSDAHTSRPIPPNSPFPSYLCYSSCHEDFNTRWKPLSTLPLSELECFQNL